jgi:hypothetical protein
VTLRIINLTKDEIEADMGEDQLEIAKKFADRLADDCGHREQFAVVRMTTVYETAIEEKPR